MMYFEGFAIKRWKPAAIIETHVFQANGKRLLVQSSLTAHILEQFDRARANSFGRALFKFQRWCWRRRLLANQPHFQGAPIGRVQGVVELRLAEGESIAEAMLRQEPSPLRCPLEAHER